MKGKLCVWKNNIQEFAGTLAFCLKISWESSKVYTITRIICKAILPLLLIAESFLGKHIIDLFSNAWMPEYPCQMFLLILSVIFIIKIFQDASQKIEQYMQVVHDEIIEQKITLRVMECAEQVDLQYFDDTEYYDKLQAASNNAYSVIQIVWNALSFFSEAVSFISILAILWNICPLYGILLFLVAVPNAIISVNYTKSLYALSVEQLTAERKKAYYQGIVLEKGFSQEVRLYGMGNILRKKYKEVWEAFYQRKRTVIRRKTSLSVVFSCLPEIICAGIGIHLGFQIFGGQATVGDYSLYTGLVSQFLVGFYSLTMSFTEIYDNKLKISKLKSIFSVESLIPDEGSICLDGIDSIEFEHVDFSYPGTNTEILHDVSFRLEKKERTAFVGLNGSGKSTIIKLMLRMYQPDNGRIKVNGIFIEEYTLSSLRKNFSVYFQEMKNYCFSLKENITISDSEHEFDEKRVEGAIRNSCCEELLGKSPNGLEASLMRFFDPEGVELSGGQHQKLALARTLYRKSSVFVLDEPSSNLDPKAEYQIFENLKKATEGKMAVFISHRLSNIALADKVIVLENGKIVEQGSQKELLVRGGLYAELYNCQREKFQIG